MSERRDPEVTDLKRRLANSVLVGTVSAVDPEKYRYRVKVGQLETDWLPMASPRAGGTRTYSSLTEGEQVTVVSPGGDISQGIILGSVAKEDRQAADKGNIHRTIYDDETVVEYDHEAHALGVKMETGSAKVTIAGAEFEHTDSGWAFKVGGVTVTITAGGLDITGGHVTHDGKEIDAHHVHTGVEPGGGLSGVPA